MRPSAVHPLQPRFAQAITGVICLEALIFQTWPAVVVALALVLVALLAPRWSPVGWLFRQIAPAPTRLEPAPPVRFSQWLAVIFLTLATAAFLVSADLAGWILTGIVAALALLSGITGICVGCAIYRLLLASGSRGGDVRGALELSGGGPWLVVLTAPGCARCGPAAQAVSDRAGDREVLTVDLARRPRAAQVAVASVPAALAIDSNGRVLASSAGRLGREDIDRVLAALPA